VPPGPPVPPPVAPGAPVPPPPPGGYQYGGIGYGPGAGAGQTPLDLPLYGASIGEAWRRFWGKYATFTGRASRSEFWWMVLILWVINAVLSGFENHRTGDGGLSGLSIAFGSIAGLWNLAVLVPSLALFWRRMHDTDRSGLNIFWWLLPIVGWIILLVYTVGDSKPEGRRFDV